MRCPICTHLQSRGGRPDPRAPIKNVLDLQMLSKPIYWKHSTIEEIRTHLKEFNPSVTCHYEIRGGLPAGGAQGSATEGAGPRPGAGHILRQRAPKTWSLWDFTSRGCLHLPLYIANGVTAVVGSPPAISCQRVNVSEGN